MVSEPRQIACPKCRAEMGRIKCGPIVVDRCGDCGGLWFDRQEYQQLVVHLEGRLDVGDPAVGASMDGIRDCPCPVCAIPMAPAAVSVRPDIWVEVCSGCDGHFFDAGEFRAYRSLLALEYLEELELPAS